MAVRQMIVAGRYRLLEPVGVGGMGRVWLARDEMLHRDVAVKEIVPPPWMSEAEQRRMRGRTLREARSAARLNHPHVVRIYDVVQAEGLSWIVMEYIPSRSLHQVLHEDGPYEPAVAARIGLALLDALDAAHRAGVLHRDVKPHNVLIGTDGRVVLTDFGLATFVDDGAVTAPGLIVGSPQYVSPERARDGASTIESDLWSLGATLYAAVEGRSPYARETAMATLAALVTEPPDPPVRAGPLTAVLDGLLRYEPASRLTALEIDRRLRMIVFSDPREIPFLPRQSRPRKSSSRPVHPAPPASGPAVPDPVGLAATPRQDSVDSEPTGSAAASPGSEPVASGTAERGAASAAVDPGAGRTAAPPRGTARVTVSHSPQPLQNRPPIPPVSPAQTTGHDRPPPRQSRRASGPTAAPIGDDRRSKPRPAPRQGGSMPAGSAAEPADVSSGTPREAPDPDLTHAVGEDSGRANRSDRTAFPVPDVGQSAASVGPLDSGTGGRLRESGSPAASGLSARSAADRHPADDGPLVVTRDDSSGSGQGGSVAPVDSGFSTSSTIDSPGLNIESVSVAGDCSHADAGTPTPTSVDRNPPGGASSEASSDSEWAAEDDSAGGVGAGSPATSLSEDPETTRTPRSPGRALVPVVGGTARGIAVRPAVRRRSGRPALMRVPSARLTVTGLVVLLLGGSLAAGYVAELTSVRPLVFIPSPSASASSLVSGEPAGRSPGAPAPGSAPVPSPLVAGTGVPATDPLVSPSGDAASVRAPAAEAMVPATPPFSPLTCEAPPSGSLPSTPLPGASRGVNGWKLQAGWSYFSDGSGFHIAVPDGWTHERIGSAHCFRSQRSARVMTFDTGRDPADDPLAASRAAERRLAASGDLPGYELIGLASVPLLNRAADWEYRYQTPTGAGRHAVVRWFLTGGKAYVLGWSTSEKTWTSDLSRIQMIRSTFYSRASR